jgi:hypothetical protein
VERTYIGSKIDYDIGSNINVGELLEVSSWVSSRSAIIVTRYAFRIPTRLIPEPYK